ncbi:MAG: hypothetical protein ACU85V_00985 [Gammaproteobacteria bacterium]
MVETDLRNRAMALLEEAIARGATNEAMRIMATGRAASDHDVSVDWPLAVLELEGLVSRLTESERLELARSIEPPVGAGGISSPAA